MLLRASVLIGLTLLLVPSASSLAQTRDIDPAKLPQTPAVLAAYRSAQNLEPYANAWTTKWNYDIPQAQVQDKLADDLGILSKALQLQPDNQELLLLTGLVAHFAYNVTDDAAFQVAIDDLTKAASADPSDVRAEWFLGIHQCQSLQVAAGMNRLLAIEEKFKNPPPDFWSDYITCATVAMLPAHTLRAIDRAVAAGAPADAYDDLKQIAQSLYKSADLTQTIPAHGAWVDQDLPNDLDKFTSHLCGVSFVVSAKTGMKIPDVANGTCVAGAVPVAKKGKPSPTFFLMARRPPEGQTLEDFVRSYLKGKDSENFNDSNTKLSDSSALPCPVQHCLSLDLVLPGVYDKQGGAHLLVVAFERDQPRYDGLPFEQPQGPLMREGKHGRAYFRADPVYHRIPGKLYYMVLLDSNQQIFADSKPQFEDFVSSIAVD